MTFEIFDTLEDKVDQLVQIMNTFQREASELKSQNDSLLHETQSLKTNNEKLLAELNALHAHYASVGDENKRLKEEFRVWQERLQQLLGKIGDIN